MKQGAMKRLHNKNLPKDIASTYLADVMAIQSEMLKRLSRRGLISLLEMGELMEDIGNRYLDVAEAIRQNILTGYAGDPTRTPPQDDE